MEKHCLNSLMNSTLISFGIDRARYHGVDLEGTSMRFKQKKHENYNR